MIFRFIFLTLVTLLAGCESGPAHPKSFMAWVSKPENGLISSANGELFKYNAKWRPMEEMAIREIGSDITTSDLNQFAAQMDGMEYILLEIEGVNHQGDVLATGITDKNAYYDRLNYLSFDFQHDIALLVGNDTIPCGMYHFERNFGIAPNLHIMLAFENRDTLYENDRNLLLYPRIEPNPNIISINIQKESIRNIPQLQLQN